MIISKLTKYYQDKALINKKENMSVAYKIQLYNDTLIDEMVKKVNEGETIVQPQPSVIYADLLALNKPVIYKNYNQIINSPYTNNEALDNLLIKAKANNDLERVAEAELKRISSNMDYINNILRNYEVPIHEYEKFVANQKKNAMSNRKEIMEQIVKNNGEIFAGGKKYGYRQVETMAESLIRQTKMSSEYEKIKAINQNYINEGKEQPYTHKVWIHTHGGKTTRHTSNHNQKREIDERFIIVNDKTGHIDELMYPCDPAGSWANTYICYCEVEYKGGDYDPTGERTSIYPTYPKPKPLPTFPKHIQKPEGKIINTKYLSNNAYGEYYVTSKRGLQYDPVTKTAKYNGLEVKNYDPNLDFGTITLEEIYEHNKKFIYEVEGTSKPELIDKTNLWEYGDYILVDANDGLVKNVETGKYEYKGLEAELYVNGNGYLSKKAIEEHNTKIKSQNNVQIVEGEPVVKKIETDVPGVESVPRYYFIDANKVEVILKDGKYYYNGLQLKDFDVNTGIGKISKKAVTKHNNEIDGKTEKRNKTQSKEPKTENIPTVNEKPKEEFIDRKKLKFDDEFDMFSINLRTDKNVVLYDGDYYYKGLKINPEHIDLLSGRAFFLVSDIMEHNETVKKNDALKRISQLQKENQKKIEVVDTQPQIEYIDLKLLGEDGEGNHIVTENIKQYNGIYYYKGMELLYYDSSIGFGYIDSFMIDFHNNEAKRLEKSNKNFKDKLGNIKGENEDNNIKKENKNHLTREEAINMDLMDIVRHYDADYIGIHTDIIDDKEYYCFRQYIKNDNGDLHEFDIYLETDAPDKYDRMSVQEVINEVFKVPENLRVETRQIWFKTSEDGIVERKNGKYVKSPRSRKGVNYYYKINSRTLKTYNNANHRITINSNFFIKRNINEDWYKIQDRVALNNYWKKTLYHEFVHSADLSRNQWNKDDGKGHSNKREFMKIHDAEPSFTRYGNSKIAEEYAEHGGYISYMEANPQDQHRKIEVIIKDEYGINTLRRITYDEYKKIYPLHYEYFIKKIYEEGF